MGLLLIYGILRVINLFTPTYNPETGAEFWVIALTLVLVLIICPISAYIEFQIAQLFSRSNCFIKAVTFVVLGIPFVIDGTAGAFFWFALIITLFLGLILTIGAFIFTGGNLF